MLQSLQKHATNNLCVQYLFAKIAKMNEVISGQADRVIRKLGGFRFVSKALDKDITALYKWTYGKHEGGTGGVIPSSALPDILDLAEMLSVSLTSEDLDPR